MNAVSATTCSRSEALLHRYWEDMYAKELDADSWKQVNELRKTDPKAADELVRTFSYHIDHGYGMDCYAVGPTLGAGVSALMVNDTIIYPWCYKTQEVLDNGPLRFTVSWSSIRWL